VKVNVIVKRLNSDRIITRFGHYLTDGDPELILSDKPDPSADINYRMLYMQGHEPVDTITGAWFTHWPTTVHKRNVYTKVAGEMDFATYSTPKYEHILEELHDGQPYFLNAVVDRDKFIIQPKIKRKKPVIGFVGYMSEKGRKQPELVQQLINSLPNLNFIAAGRGWPCFTYHYDWSELQDFYANIDVWVCTSKAEALPAPLLEALSCGTKVVMPIGCGLASEFRESIGVRFYNPNSLYDLITTLKVALYDNANPDYLRSLTEIYSIENWQKNHKDVFRKVLENEKT
jgi:glycosyltransferase involved in cell wall biosynthesis